MKETTMLIALLSGLMRGADLEYAEQPRSPVTPTSIPIRIWCVLSWSPSQLYPRIQMPPGVYRRFHGYVRPICHYQRKRRYDKYLLLRRLE